MEERLDRAMCTESWNSLFPNVRLQNLVAFIFDHSHLLLSTCDVVSLPFNSIPDSKVLGCLRRDWMMLHMVAGAQRIELIF